jgi:large subunit ribosomal protein L10
LERTEKAQIIDQLRDSVGRAKAAFVTEYQGITAVEMDEFRKDLREADIDFKVVRNTLANRAIEGTGCAGFKEHLNGPVALVFGYDDAATTAKKLVEFAKEQPKLKLRAGVIGDDTLSLNEIKALAELPSKDVMLAKIIGSMNAPASGFVNVLSGVPRALVYTLSAIRDSKESAA